MPLTEGQLWLATTTGAVFAFGALAMGNSEPAPGVEPSFESAGQGVSFGLRLDQFAGNGPQAVAKAKGADPGTTCLIDVVTGAKVGKGGPYGWLVKDQEFKGPDGTGTVPIAVAAKKGTRWLTSKPMLLGMVDGDIAVTAYTGPTPALPTAASDPVSWSRLDSVCER